MNQVTNTQIQLSIRSTNFDLLRTKIVEGIQLGIVDYENLPYETLLDILVDTYKEHLKMIIDDIPAQDFLFSKILESGELEAI